MKKAILLVAIIYFVFSSPALAAENATTLKEAKISIETFDDIHYEITESISLNDIEGVGHQKLLHTFSTVESSTLNDLVVLADGKELQYEWEKGNSLNKLIVQLPENSSGEFNYELKYNLSLEAESFTTPLFVPSYPSAGTSNIVHISFKAPDGESIQKNSFPVVIKKVGNEVENHIMNIPSHVKYIHSEETSMFNFFNYMSWGVMICLVAIIAVWLRAELANKKGVVA